MHPDPSLEASKQGVLPLAVPERGPLLSCTHEKEQTP